MKNFTFFSPPYRFSQVNVLDKIRLPGTQEHFPLHPSPSPGPQPGSPPQQFVHLPRYLSIGIEACTHSSLTIQRTIHAYI